ncbi:filamentous hemagglutinin N-terminal domain-containing protein [Fortiea contorta]|uniref:two-partner secretion domain-containing protein n=1 Tax=Fortiea contorta TaxID=1892405 RepID=UPI00037123E7|nr:filamentous hemagglutinin N-terminal domain-containing protein [Fortiea contorta]
MSTNSCGWVLGIVIICGSSLAPNWAIAQITPDTSLPTATQVDTIGNTTNITGGTQAGTNLFHSFREFSIPTGNTAFFQNTADIQNIISRVTGGSRSDIDGLIRANGTANLFLINPNGIVFGQNARLDIGGSFIASTANIIKFADGTEYRVADNASPLLTISVPLGLQFGSNPQGITVRGVGHEYNYQADIVDRINANQPGLFLDTQNPGLQVREGKTLALVGGSVSLDGAILKAPGGRVEIFGAGSNGSVNLQQVTTGGKVESDPFADIQIANKSWIGTTGIGGGEIALTGKDIRFASESIVRADTTGGQNGKGISIVGDSIDINQSSLAASTFGAGNGGAILFDAKNIKFENSTAAFTETYSTALGAGKAGDVTFKADSIGTNQSPIRSNSFGVGHGGNININAKSLQISYGGGTGANVFDAGNGGDTTIKVGELIINFSGIGSTVFTRSTGDAGKVNITADTLQLTYAGIGNGTQKDSTGDGGDITLNIDQITLNAASIIAKSEGTGNGGKISINTKRLEITDGGEVSTNTTNTGKAGELEINVAGDFTLKSAIVNNISDGTGSAGKVTIQANSLNIEGGGGINAIATDQGNAGDINIHVKDQFNLQGGAINAGSSGAGNGGIINISAGDFRIINAGGISANSAGTGNGGKININVNKLHLESSPISTNTTNTAQAGEIDINVTDSFILINTFITNTSDGTGNGGKIKIQANSFDIEGGAGINAIATNQGNAGDININVKDQFNLQGGSINAGSSGAGNGGKINISAGNFNIVSAEGIISETLSTGAGGDININVKDQFNLQTSAIYTNSSDVGNGGKININAGNFNIFSAGIISEARNRGAGGDINIQIENLFNIENGGGIRAIASGIGGSGTIKVNAGNFQIENAEIISKSDSLQPGGDIKIDAKNSFILSKGSLYTTSSGAGNSGIIDIIAGGKFEIKNSGIITETQGTGKGGDIKIDVKELVLKEPGDNPNSLATRIMASSINNGNAGNIELFADYIVLDGIVAVSSNVGSTAAPIVTINNQEKTPKITVTPRGNSNTIFPDAVGNSGNITINSQSVSVKNGAQLTTSNFGQGNAGNIKITTLDAIFDGRNSTNTSGASSSIAKDAVGNGGTIEINTNNLTLTNGAQLTTSNLNQGNAGDIIIRAADKFFIDGVIGQSSNTGVFAESQTGQGGNITISADLMVLRRGGLISNISRVEGAAGIDGNVDINTKFLVAVPQENSDIIAIGSGRNPGSNIQVRSQGIFGTQIRKEQTPESDIVATGQATLNILDPDPNNGLVAFPTYIVDASRLINQNVCAARKNNSSFTSTGRGGLPLSPDDVLRGRAIITPWVTWTQENEQRVTQQPTPEVIVEAQGWVTNDKGEVTLVAAVPTVTPHHLQNIPSGCQDNS